MQTEALSRQPKATTKRGNCEAGRGGMCKWKWFQLPVLSYSSWWTSSWAASSDFCRSTVFIAGGFPVPGTYPDSPLVSPPLSTTPPGSPFMPRAGHFVAICLAVSHSGQLFHSWTRQKGRRRLSSQTSLVLSPHSFAPHLCLSFAA